MHPQEPFASLFEVSLVTQCTTAVLPQRAFLAVAIVTVAPAIVPAVHGAVRPCRRGRDDHGLPQTHAGNAGRSMKAVLARHRVTGHVEGGMVTPLRALPSRGRHRDEDQQVDRPGRRIALALDKRQAHVYREGGTMQVEVPPARRACALLPLSARLSVVPRVTAVLGLEQYGTPLLLRLLAPDVAHVLIAHHDRVGQDRAGRTLLASLAMHNRQGLVQFVLIDPEGRSFAGLEALPQTRAVSSRRRGRRRAAALNDAGNRAP